MWLNSHDGVKSVKGAAVRKPLTDMFNRAGDSAFVKKKNKPFRKHGLIVCGSFLAFISMVKSASADHSLGRPCVNCHSLLSSNVVVGSKRHIRCSNVDDALYGYNADCSERTTSYWYCGKNVWDPVPDGNNVSEPLDCSYCHDTADDIANEIGIGTIQPGASAHPVDVRGTSLDIGIIKCNDCHNNEVAPVNECENLPDDAYPNHFLPAVKSEDPTGANLRTYDYTHLAGKYGDFTDNSTYGVDWSSSLSGANTPLCFNCHKSGGIANTDIEADYASANGGHNIVAFGDLPAKKLPCSDCHDPHASNDNAKLIIGNSDIPNNPYKKSFNAGAAPYDYPAPSGFNGTNDYVVCVSCHDAGRTVEGVVLKDVILANGSTDPFSPIFPFHSNAHDDVGGTTSCLQSNSGCHQSAHNLDPFRCLDCHSKSVVDAMASPPPRLVAKDHVDSEFAHIGHVGPGDSDANFIASVHTIPYNDAPGADMTVAAENGCLYCHNTAGLSGNEILKDADGTTYSRPAAAAWVDFSAYNEFCLSCHDGDPNIKFKPSSNYDLHNGVEGTGGNLINYAYGSNDFLYPPQVNSQSGVVGGYFFESGHGRTTTDYPSGNPAADIPCLQCHLYHGSTAPKLLPGWRPSKDLAANVVKKDGGLTVGSMWPLAGSGKPDSAKIDYLDYTDSDNNSRLTQAFTLQSRYVSEFTVEWNTYSNDAWSSVVSLGMEVPFGTSGDMRPNTNSANELACGADADSPPLIGKFGFCNACHFSDATTATSHRIYTHEGQFGGEGGDENGACTGSPLDSDKNFFKDCAECHDPHGSGEGGGTGVSNLYMIKGKIKRGADPLNPASWSEVVFTSKGGAMVENDDSLDEDDLGPSELNSDDLCAVCHGADPAPGDPDQVGVDHNYQTYSGPPDHAQGAECAQCHDHGWKTPTTNRQWAGFKRVYCFSCHGNKATGQYWPDGTGGDPAYADDSAGAHANHVAAIGKYLGYGDYAVVMYNDVQQKTICAFCHPNPGSGTHTVDSGGDQRVDVYQDSDDVSTRLDVFRKFTGGGVSDLDVDGIDGNQAYSYANKNCLNLACHNRMPTPAATAVPAERAGDWDAPPDMTAFIVFADTDQDELPFDRSYRVGCFVCHGYYGMPRTIDNGWLFTPSDNFVEDSFHRTHAGRTARDMPDNVDPLGLTGDGGMAYACYQCHGISTDGINDNAELFSNVASNTGTYFGHLNGVVELEFSALSGRSPERLEVEFGGGNGFFDKDATGDASAGDTGFAPFDGNYSITCYNIYCHGETLDSRPDDIRVNPVYDQAATADCGDCHDADYANAGSDFIGSAPTGKIQSNGHYAHYGKPANDAAYTNPEEPPIYGPLFGASWRSGHMWDNEYYGFDDLDPPPPNGNEGYMGGCGYCHFIPRKQAGCRCHDGTGSPGAGAISTRHVNGIKEFRDMNSRATPDDDAPADLTSTTACDNCHSTALAPNETISGAQLAKNNWYSAGYRLPCQACHNSAAAASNYADGTGPLDSDGTRVPQPYWLQFADPQDNFDLSGHGFAGIFPQTGNQAPAYSCTACHDQDSRHIMIRDDRSGYYWTTEIFPNNRFKEESPGAPFTADNICDDCHAPDQTAPGTLGFDAAVEATDHSTAISGNYGVNPAYAYECVVCHDPHGTLNIAMIKETIADNMGADATNVTLNAENGLDPTSAANDGVCDRCHADPLDADSHAASLHPNNHNYGMSCIICHKHDNTFAPACNDCHGSTADLTGRPPTAPTDLRGETPVLVWNAVVDPDAGAPAGAGNHRTVGSTTPSIDYSSHENIGCGECHTDTPGFDVNHNDGLPNATMDNIAANHVWNGFGGPLAAAWNKGLLDGANDGSGGPGSVTDDYCDNIDCHSPHGLYQATNYSGTPQPYRRYWLNSTLWDCYACHPYNGKDATSRPSKDVISSGSHSVHAGGAAMFRYFLCTECHVDNAGNINHKNGALDFSFATDPYGVAETVSADGLAPTDGDNAGAGHRAYGTCQNVYCHSNVQTDPPGGLPVYAAPVWGSGVQCGDCHEGLGHNPVGEMTTGSHSAHRYDCFNCHWDESGGETQCVHCHSTHAASDPLPPVHSNAIIELPLSWTLGGATYDGTYDTDADFMTDEQQGLPGAAYGRCTNLYCHSDAKTVKSFITPVTDERALAYAQIVWGSVNPGCEGCHGNSPENPANPDSAVSYQFGAPDYDNDGTSTQEANSHKKHVDNNIACAVCHNATITDADPSDGWTLIMPAIPAKPLHADGVINVELEAGYDNNGATSNYDAATKTCSAVSCHGDSTPQWGQQNASPITCQNCHLSASADIDDFAWGGFSGTTALINSDEWQYSGHGRQAGSYDVSGNGAANFYGIARTSDAEGCRYCHDFAVGHGVAANPFRLANNNALGNGIAADNGYGWNDACLVCHSSQDADGFDPDGAGADYGAQNGVDVDENHFGAKHVNAAGGQFCWDCHDPHGDRSSAPLGNIYMVQSQVSKSTSDNYGVPQTLAQVDFSTKTIPGDIATTTGYYVELTANDPKQGVCQACHDPASASPTLYWRSDGTDAGPVPSAHNSAQICTECHSHQRDFKPVCNICHGDRAGESYFYPDDGAGGNPAGYPNRLGKHAEHVAAIANFSAIDNIIASDDSTCNWCHPGGGHTGDQLSAPADLHDINPVPTGTNFKDIAGNIDPDGEATIGVDCSSVNCHYNKTATIADWYGAPAVTCEYCHYYRDGAAYPTVAWVAGALPDAHQVHVAGIPAPDNQHSKSYLCSYCHDVSGYANNHMNASIDLSTAGNPTLNKDGDPLDETITPTSTAVKYGAGVADSVCTEMWCHGADLDPIIQGIDTSPVWNDQTTGTCGDCHDVNTESGPFKEPLTQGAHEVHMAQLSGVAYGPGMKSHVNRCQICHGWYGFDGGCGGYCHQSHGSLMPGAPGDAGYAWEPSKSHVEGNFEVDFEGQDRGWNDVFAGPGYTAAGTLAVLGNTWDTGTDICNLCHSTATVNGAIGATLAKQQWTTGVRLPCLNCHNSAAPANSLPVNGGLAAPAKDAYYATTGHGLPAANVYNATKHGQNGPEYDCPVCHDEASTHFSAALGDSDRLDAVAGDALNYTDAISEVCLDCHAPGGSGGTLGYDATAEASVHSGGVSGNYAPAATAGNAYGNSADFTVDPGYQCNACHDPHGTSKLAMILSEIDGNLADLSNPVVVAGFESTDLDMADLDPTTGDNDGVCDVCHTGATDPPHPDASHPGNHNQGTIGYSCAGCHDHTASFKASCSGCHGGATIGQSENNYWPDGPNTAGDNTTPDNSGAHAAHMRWLADYVYGETITGAVDDDILKDNTTANPGLTSVQKQKVLCEYCHQAVSNDADHGVTANLPAEVYPTAAYNKRYWDGASDAAPVASFDGGTYICSDVDCHFGGATPTPNWYDPGPIACITCHAGTPTGAGTHVPALYPNCTDCHPGGAAYPIRHSSNGGAVFEAPLPPTDWDNPGTAAVENWDMQARLGIHYKIHLGGDAVTGTVEADICWNCHGSVTPTPVSEWGFNTKTTPTGFPVVAFATQHDGSQQSQDYGWIYQSNYATKVADWTQGYWMSEYDALLKRRIASTHSASFDPAGQSSSVAVNVNASGVVNRTSPVFEAKSYFRCSYCHDVHDVFGPNGKPYLRGLWTGNPYPAELPPRSTYSYTTRVNVLGPATPRALSTARDKGGYFIDQNSNWPTNNAAMDTLVETAELCTLCHGTDVDNMDFYTGATLWRTGMINGHSNSTLGGTRINAVDLFTGSRYGFGMAMQKSVPNTPWNCGYYGDQCDSNYPQSLAMSWYCESDCLNLRNSGWFGGAVNTQTFDGGDYANWYGTGTIGGASGAGTMAHKFSCSKCHSPHASGLPALLIHNCIDPSLGNWTIYGKTGTNLIANNCHRKTAVTDGWHKLAPGQ